MPFRDKMLEHLPVVSTTLVYKSVPIEPSKFLLPALIAEEAKKTAATELLRAEEAASIRRAALDVGLKVTGVAAAVAAAGFSGITAYTSFYGSGAKLIESDMRYEELNKRFEKLKMDNQDLRNEKSEMVQERRFEKSFNDHKNYTDKATIDDLRAKVALKWWQK